jgi:hypothetical protein
MLIIGAVIDSFRSLKDKTIKITLETQEPTPEQFLKLAELNQKFGYFLFKSDEFNEDEIKIAESLESDFKENKKSKSKILRNVLYLNYKQNNQGYKEFDTYYKKHLEDIIKHFKNKLE